MKIIIPTEEKNSEGNVSDIFGRAKYFAVYDSEKDIYDFVENIGGKSVNGAGIKAAQQVIDLKADAVILPRIGKNGADLLEAADIKLYKQEASKIKANLKSFKNGDLLSLDEVHAGFHGGV